MSFSTGSTICSSCDSTHGSAEDLKWVCTYSFLPNEGCGIHFSKPFDTREEAELYAKEIHDEFPHRTTNIVSLNTRKFAKKFMDLSLSKSIV